MDAVGDDFVSFRHPALNHDPSPVVRPEVGFDTNRLVGIRGIPTEEDRRRSVLDDATQRNRQRIVRGFGRLREFEEGVRTALRQLRQALEDARLAQQTLRQRMDEARAQVRSALGRLPDAAPQE